MNLECLALFCNLKKLILTDARLTDHASEIAGRDLAFMAIKGYLEKVAVTNNPELTVACAFTFSFLKAKIN